MLFKRFLCGKRRRKSEIGGPVRTPKGYSIPKSSGLDFNSAYTR